MARPLSALKPLYYQTVLTSRHLAQLLEEAIEKALGNDKRKLVIFIDDLDRCMPESALKLLEGIKVYLNLKNCVVVFGMDQRQIENSLKVALKLNEKSGDNTGEGDYHAREYLEKICQDIYHLPLPDKAKKADYLYSLLQRLLNNSAQPNVPNTHADELKKVLDAYDCLPANPRKIKALVNRLMVLLKKLTPLPTFTPPTSTTPSSFVSKGLKPEYGVLLIVSIIYTFHRRLNEQLAKNASYIQTIITFAGSSPSATLNPMFEPMTDIKPSYDGSSDLPVNPSDSHVFRLHRILLDLGSITEHEISPFLNK